MTRQYTATMYGPGHQTVLAAYLHHAGLRIKRLDYDTDFLACAPTWLLACHVPSSLPLLKRALLIGLLAGTVPILHTSPPVRTQNADYCCLPAVDSFNLPKLSAAADAFCVSWCRRCSLTQARCRILTDWPLSCVRLVWKRYWPRVRRT